MLQEALGVFGAQAAEQAQQKAKKPKTNRWEEQGDLGTFSAGFEIHGQVWRWLIFPDFMTAMCWGNGLSIWLSHGWSPPTETTLLSIILLTIQYKLEHSNFASFQCCFPYLNFPLHWCILNSVYKMNNYLKKTYRSHTKMFCCLLAGLSFSPHIT